jgi:hypothetical protein
VLRSRLASAFTQALAAARLPVGAAALAALLLLPLASAPALAGSPSAECGQLTNYTAPDPVAPADGSLQLGTSPAWDVLAAATIPANVASALSSGGGSGPTCLALGFDGTGKIASIDFAAQGTLNGPVTFDSGSGYYLLADRLLLPKTIADSNPVLSALFEGSNQAGTPLKITFHVNTTTGAFESFVGSAAFCGPASLDSKNVGHVGKAKLPAAVLGTTARKNLKAFAGRRVCATVHGTGSIDPDSGDLSASATTAIVLANPGPAVTPPATTTSSEAAASTSPAFSELAWAVVLAIAAGLALLLGVPRRRVRR